MHPKVVGVFIPLLAMLCLAVPALAADAKPKAIPKSVFPESERVLTGGRDIVVVVSQAEISSNINPSQLTAAMQGGLLPALIDAKIDSDRAKRALTGITPIRSALIDVDVDQLAIETTQIATKSLPWFDGRSQAFDRDPTNLAKSDRLSAATADQVAFFDYVYDFDPNFGSLRVGVRITIANKAPAKSGKPEDRLSYKYLAFSQNLTSVAVLKATGEAGANSQMWAANNGALTKSALHMAFKDLETLIPRALTTSVDDLEAMKAAKGRVNVSTDGVQLTATGLVHVQAAGE